jgi:hypothetical protein
MSRRSAERSGLLAVALATAIAMSLAPRLAWAQDQSLVPVQVQSQAPAATQSAAPQPNQDNATQADGSCPGHPGALGTSRVLALDPAQYPRVGHMQYPDTLPLNDKEVVLTFDNGPIPTHLRPILREYAAYYNGLRTHRALNQDAPSIGRLSPSAPSHHDPFSAVFITNIAESRFSAHTGRNGRAAPPPARRRVHASPGIPLQ